MCLIVDINVSHCVFLIEHDPDLCDVHAALFGPRKSNVRISYGGKLLEEYAESGELIRAVAALDRAGRAQKVDDSAVNQEEVAVSAAGLCRSNDAHITALARLGGARLLCSEDNELHADFTNRKLLHTPRGKVYQNRTHRPLFTRCCK